MVEILCFREELPGVRVYAKAEYANPGGSLKDRPVRRILFAVDPVADVVAEAVVDELEPIQVHQQHCELKHNRRCAD